MARRCVSIFISRIPAAKAQSTALRAADPLRREMVGQSWRPLPARPSRSGGCSPQPPFRAVSVPSEVGGGGFFFYPVPVHRAASQAMSKHSKSFSAVVRDYKRGHFVPGHSHEWPQLLYASSGVMSVETPHGSWIVPAHRAVWLPARCVHETRMLTDVRFNSLYVRASRKWRTGCKVIEISPLLRELILVARTIVPDRKSIRRDDLVMELIAEELQVAESAASAIPMPREVRLLRLCRAVIENPSLRIKFDMLAADAGGSTKTFTRLFDRELGMTFREWRELVQIAHATAHLARGNSIKAAASLMGYSPGAFSVMLRRVTGSTPRAFQQQIMNPRSGTPVEPAGRSTRPRRRKHARL